MPFRPYGDWCHGELVDGGLNGARSFPDGLGRRRLAGQDGTAFNLGEVRPLDDILCVARLGLDAILAPGISESHKS